VLAMAQAGGKITFAEFAALLKEAAEEESHGDRSVGMN